MTVKVEMMKNEKTGVVALAFESSRGDKEETDIIDFIHRTVMGDDFKEAGYINSNRLVVHLHGVIEPEGGYPRNQAVPRTRDSRV